MTREPDEPGSAAAERWPRLLRFLGLHLVLGAALGVIVSSALVLSNTGGLKDLLAGDQSPVLGLVLLHFMLALTGGSVAMGVAVMTMPREETPDSTRRRDHDRPL